MKIKQIFLLVLMMSISFTISAQDASFFKKYADKGDKEAMYHLAECYRTGTGGVQYDGNQAIYWLTKAAKKNYAPAQVKLARCYYYGTGVVRDEIRAWELVLKAVKQGNAEGYFLEANMHYDSKNYGSWFQNLKSSATLGYADAQAELGRCYLFGDQEANITADVNLAITWLKKATDQGSADGTFCYGLCHLYGAGLEKDEEKAYKYFYTAANLGQSLAQCQIAEAYLAGNYGFEMNFQEARKYVNAALGQDCAKAYAIMGDIYFFGLGEEVNYNKAAECYQKASDEGISSATTKLASMYMHGDGVAKNENNAFQLCKKAADAGDPNGLAGVASCYEQGIGVKKAMSTAISYYIMAAEKGDNFSSYRLYLLYSEGNEVNKDTNLAIQYLRQAADNGYNDAIYRLGVEYMLGEILHPEPTTAIRYMTTAADNGMDFAAGVLGTIFYSGDETIAKDYNKAFKYLTQAIQSPEDFGENLLSEIYRDLAACYRFGRGTKVDQSLASYYTEQAAKYGDEGSVSAVKDLMR